MYFYDNIVQNIPKLEKLDIINGIEIPEIWLPITNLVVPNIKFGYYFSNYGRIYSTVKSPKGPGLKRTFMDRNYRQGHLHLQLAVTNGREVSRKVHRLVMLTFRYIPDADLYVVNHLDGDPNNNKLWNLEWTTNSGNVIHAIDNNLSKVFNNDYKVIDINILNLAFIDYNNGYLVRELCDKYGINETSLRLIIGGHNRKYLKETYNLFTDTEIESSFECNNTEIIHLISDMICYYDDDLENILDYVKSNYIFSNPIAAIINVKRKYRYFSRIYNVQRLT